MNAYAWAPWLAAAGLLLAAVLLLITARRWNPLFVLTGIYSILAPLSAARASSLLVTSKVGRVSCAVLICALGLIFVRKARPGLATSVFLAFVALNLLGAFYSEAPWSALQFKGLFALVAVAGTLTAYSLRDATDLERGMRILAVASVVFGVALLVEVAIDPFAFSAASRLQPWGLNANRIGHEAAAFLGICLAVGLNDSSFRWRTIGRIAAGLFALAVLASGSRASVAFAVLTAGILFIPSVRRPVILVTILPLLALAIFGAAHFLNPEVKTRLADASIEDRLVIWEDSLEKFSDAPLLGQGWLFTTDERRTGSPMNLHNMYIQVLVEGGLISTLFFAISLIVIQLQGLMLYAQARRRRAASTPYAFFPLAMVTGLMIHGVAESSLLQGTSLIALMFPFSIALMDRLTEFMRVPKNAKG